MGRLLQFTPRTAPEETTELLLELTHVSGQLHACSHPDAAQPLIDELVDIAHQLSVPTEQPRADAANFLGDPERIGSASWAQCGGLLYALCQECPDNRLQVGSRVAERLLQLAPTFEPRS